MKFSIKFKTSLLFFMFTKIIRMPSKRGVVRFPEIPRQLKACQHGSEREAAPGCPLKMPAGGQTLTGDGAFSLLSGAGLPVSQGCCRCRNGGLDTPVPRASGHSLHSRRTSPEWPSPGGWAWASAGPARWLSGLKWGCRASLSCFQPAASTALGNRLRSPFWPLSQSQCEVFGRLFFFRTYTYHKV